MDYSSLYNELDLHNYHTSNSTANELVFIPLLKKETAGKHMLDIGCGTCAALPKFQTLYQGGAYAMEVSPKAVQVAHSLGRASGCNDPPCLVQASITRIPWKNQTFDTIVSSDVFEHITPADLPRAIAETRRVLARDGIVLLSIATGSSKRSGIELHATQRDMTWWQHAFRPLVPIPISPHFWRAMWNVRTSRWNWRGPVCESAHAIRCGNVFLALTDSSQNARRRSSEAVMQTIAPRR